LKNEQNGAPRARSKFMLGRSIGLVALAGSLALPSLAYAQDAAPAQVAEDTSNDIVVTARKREERLQDVPIAVTALSATALEAAGAADTQDLAKLAPGLFYSSFAPSIPNVFVRGIGTRSYDAGAESSIGTFVDGVYIARFAAQIQDLADVERVEVLRGPQGALFGRNTIGGAINIVTQQPGAEFHADLGITYGQADHFDGEEASISALLSGPLAADRLYAQIAYTRRETDGATQIEGTNELANGATNEAARGRLVFRAGGDLEFDLSADTF
jgi:iron complex outermembrane receptor protein